MTTEQKLFQNNVSLQKEIETRIQIAIKLIKRNQPESAVVQLKKAMQLDPDSPRVYEIMAIAFEQMGEMSIAQNHFKKMRRLDSDYTRGQANYAAFLIRQENYKQAYTQLSDVVEDIYYPSRAIAFQQLAFCAGKLGQTDQAEHYYRRAIHLEPNLPDSLLELAELTFNKQNYVDSQAYLNGYRQKVKPANAKSLLLGIKLARVFEDKADETSYVLALKNLYPRSKEYLEYLNAMRVN